MNVVVDPNDTPAMAKAVEKAILEGLPLTHAVVPSVNLTALPDQLKPAEEFLTALDKTIHIPLEGTECRYDVRRDRIEMPPPWCLPSLDTFLAVCLHENLHWTESVLKWQGTPDSWELRSEIGEAVFIQLFGLEVVGPNRNYEKWHGYWLRGIQRDDHYVSEILSSALDGVDFLIRRALEPRSLSPRRRYINHCFQQLIDYVREQEAAGAMA